MPDVERNVTRQFADSTVLVTGAAGMIGTETCHQPLGHLPANFILLVQLSRR